jgi:Lar family restriction alleviation protein
MKEKLEPCPFCKEKEEIYQDRYRDDHWNVHCMICGASGPNKQTEAEAIKAWNGRLKK